MKERLLDAFKWSIIVLVAGCVFYVVCPKYSFTRESLIILRHNQITGQVDSLIIAASDNNTKWERLPLKKKKQTE